MNDENVKLHSNDRWWGAGDKFRVSMCYVKGFDVLPRGAFSDELSGIRGRDEFITAARI